MSECIFCKIVSGEIPSSKVFEDEWTYAFMDVANDVEGHMLVVPKVHTKNILDCDEETLMHLMKTVKRISNHPVDNCGYDGVNLLNAIATSGLILVLVTSIVGRFFQDPTITAIVDTIARGSLIAIMLILVFLPGILICLDKLVIRKSS